MKRTILILVILLSVVTGVNAQSKGYQKSIELNGAVALDKNSKYSFGAAMVNGYRFNNYFYLAGVAGYKSMESLYMTSSDYIGSTYKGYDRSYDSRNLIQLSIRAKANLSKSNISPFLQIDLGYSFDLNSNKEAGMANGFLVEPGIGVDFQLLNSKNAIYFLISYNIHQATYREFDLNPDHLTSATTGGVMNKTAIGQLEFTLGFKF